MANRQFRIRTPARDKTHLGPLSKKMLFTWFILGGLIVLFAPQNLTNKFQFAFANIFRGPLSIGRNISLSAHTQSQTEEAVSRIKYDQLQNHLANITEELNRERQKVESLSGLRNRRPLEGAKLLLADVVTLSAEGLIINRGHNDEVQKGQFVLGDNSVIGTISAVSPRTARVELITEGTSNMAVEIGGLKTVIEGDGKNSVKVRLVSTKHKVKVGDNVYACKQPGFLDSPMIIGTVSQCKRNDENPLLWDITVKPACDIERLNDVTVIIMNPPEHLKI
ncbi:MAG: rod shape-determining protein MreC [Sedimentisphaerales bacterium]|nr:rod shape-determining protein MreC [Sedimentisphaerales bacterium]